jgi:hypothetical protein
MTEPVIDIFIAYWGDAGYAIEAVRSVLAQTSSAWHLTVIDDAYPGTELARYVTELNHPQVKYVRKDRNEGITENFRTGVALATLPLMVSVGCDDRLQPNYVEQIVKAYTRHPEADMIQPGVQVIDEDGQPVRPLTDRVKAQLRPRGKGYLLLAGEQLAANLLTGDWLYWPSLAFRTERLKQTPFRDGFPVTQDLALVMDLVFAGAKLGTFDTICFEYRRHSQSASAVQAIDTRRFAAEREYFSLAAEIAKAKGWRRATAAANARLTSRAHALTLLPGALARGDLRSSRELIRHGFGS